MITFMQLVRLLTVFAYYPFLYRFLARKGIIEAKNLPERESEEPKNIFTGAEIDLTKKEKIRGILVPLGVCSIGGLIGYFSGLPAGAMVFSMFFAILANLFYKKTYMPLQMRFGVQIMSGAFNDWQCYYHAPDFWMGHA